ncbi:MAG: hypothetical protein AAF354_14790 [Pseudomonadota bacterium]
MNRLVTDHTLTLSNRLASGAHDKSEPVALIHGTPSSSFVWRIFLPRGQERAELPPRELALT